MGGDSGTRIKDFLTSSFIEVNVASRQLLILELLLMQQAKEVRNIQVDGSSIIWTVSV